MTRTAKDLEFLVDQNLNNLADIPDNEDLIIKYLLHRCEKGEVYTWIGEVLLAINPRQTNLYLYDKPVEDYYTKFSTISEQALTKPHAFAIASRVRHRLTHSLGKVDQVIIISGDSGSGKTFSASKILGFLAATNRRQDCVCSYTLSRIEKACLVISAFSTASTQCNQFSSRHGQLVKLQYLNDSIQGAVVNSFLLEQSRVTNGSNNFLIFGQMLAGLPEPELETLKLSRDRFYKITNIGSIDQKNLVKGFKDNVEAMNSLGLLEDQRKEIFKVIAFLVHLGNLEFKQGDDTGCDVDVNNKDSADSLEAARSLMEFSTPDLVKLLTTSLIRPRSRSQRHSFYYSVIATTQLCKTRLHSIVRFLYYRLFCWLVDRLNKVLKCEEENPKLLGILDIFGIEYFSENSVEQLSINYANEKMQVHFIEKYLEAGRKELEDEGLSTSPPPPTSLIHQQRLAAIEKGLFPVLNDACLVARIEQLSCTDCLEFPTSKEFEEFIQNRGETFTIHHYSCLVEYRTADILCKNTDKVPAELLSTFALCKNKFIQSILYDDGERSGSTLDNKKNTTLAKLKQSMDALIKELDKYDLHYVRCMKPVDGFDDPRIIEQFKDQLSCSGILDVLPLARCTLPIRLKYDEFERRYSPQMIDDNEFLSTEIGDPMQMCEIILKRVLNRDELQSLVHFGKRLIFLTETVLFKLETMRNEFQAQCASRMQSVWYERVPKETAERYTVLESSNLISDSENKDRTNNDSTSMQDSEEFDKTSNFLVDVHNRNLFYQNRILSRQRLATIPVRFHTRLTCLKNSHCLPRSELPNGLKDCL